ncbi:MAG: hypothetical protein M1823_006369, partial [Watsoniomyces obsoletus]
MEKEISIEGIPATVCHIRAQARKGRLLIDSGASPAKLHAAWDALVAATDVGVANQAIYAAIANRAIKELQKKKDWKKSTARLKASPNKDSQWWTRAQIDRALNRKKEQEQEALRKRQERVKKGTQNARVQDAPTAPILVEEQVDTSDN